MLLDIVWNLDPVIFETSLVSPRWYGLLFASGFVLGYMMLAYFYRREKQPETELDSLLLHMVAGTVIGARLGHIIFYNPGYYFENPLQIFNLPDGGLASHGAGIGITIALWLWSRRYKRPLLWAMDRMAPAVALGCSFIRMGNLLNSELVGKVSNAPWAFTFVRYYGDRIPQPRHPVQLYESLSYLAIAVLLFVLYHKGWDKKLGRLTGIGFILVFSIRSYLEIFKEHQIALEYEMPFHMGQILSIPFIIIGIYLFIRSFSQKENKING